MLSITVLEFGSAFTPFTRQPSSVETRRMGITVAVSGTTGLLPTPACKFFTLTSQNKLPELHAAIGLQLGFGEEMAAIGNIAAAVAISCQDGIIFSLSKKCRFLI